jgi:hypothetical protein
MADTITAVKIKAVHFVTISIAQVMLHVAVSPSVAVNFQALESTIS